jgi:hypothetical protein
MELAQAISSVAQERAADRLLRRSGLLSRETLYYSQALHNLRGSRLLPFSFPPLSSSLQPPSSFAVTGCAYADASWLVPVSHGFITSAPLYLPRFYVRVLA